MNNLFRAMAIALVACAPRVEAVDPDNLNLITFDNQTGVSIQYLFLSPGDSRHWSTDILGSSRVLRDGEELGFFMHYPEACNEFDIYAVGSNDAAYLVFGHEICDGRESVVPLSRRDLADSAPDFDFSEVTLVNSTDYEILYLFFSPGYSSMWGVDQLDRHTTLAPGDSLGLLLPVGNKKTRYDVRAVDEDEDTYTFYVNIGGNQDDHVFHIENSDLD